MFSDGIVLDDVRIVWLAPIGFIAFFSGLELFSLCKHRQRISPPGGVFFVVKVTVRGREFCVWVSFCLPPGVYGADPGHFASPAAFLWCASFPAPSVPIQRGHGCTG